MKRRPPSARACSARATKLTKTASSRAGKLLRECAATPRRSRTARPKARATEATCRKRGIALQSGRTGKSTRSATAARLASCGKSKGKRKNPSRPKKVDLFDAKTGEYIASTMRYRTVREAVAAIWDEYGLRAVGRIDRTSSLRDNPAHAVRVIGSKTTSQTVRGATFRRRFLLLRQGLAMDWIEVSPASHLVGFVDKPHHDPEMVSATIRREDARAALAEYVARRGSAW